MILRPYQLEAKKAVFAKLAEAKSTLVEMATGLGKCHRRGQGILMFDGTVKKVEDIKPGDSVMGPNSFPRIVIKTSCGHGRMVAILPIKGDPWVVNEDHVLTLVRTNRGRKLRTRLRRDGSLSGKDSAQAGAVVDVPVKEWTKWSDSEKHLHKLFRVSVDFDSCIDIDNKRAITVDPYFLGVVLGDGGITRNVGVTTADEEVVSAVHQEAESRGLSVSVDPAGDISQTYKVVTYHGGRNQNALIKELRLLGLMGLRSGDKFIPHAYKVATKRHRLAILAGLIDTDGSLTGGCYDYISKSRLLANDVAFVARSVGLAAYVTPSVKADQNGVSGQYYRVIISGNIDSIPCRVPRKKAKRRQHKKNVLRTGFSVKPLGEEDYFGFTLTGDGRYLLDDFTVTHNTIIFSHIANEWPGRVLVIAHRDELIRQAAEKMQAVTYERVGIEMGRERSEDVLYGTKVTVGSIQTLARSNRRARFHPDHFSLIVVDEGHHAAAVTYREVLDYFGSAKRLFVTATPKRADQVAMEHICETVAFQYGIEPAIDDGWLVPVQQTVVKVEGLDFSKARTVAEDFNAADLDRILTEEEPLHAMCASAFELIGTRQALWFCVSVSHAKLIAGVLGRYATGGVRHLSGDTPKEDRRLIVDSYKAGNIQHLVNCAMFLEGFDAPSTSAIVMGRPTKHIGLYMQVLGRGTRPLPGIVDGIDTAEQRRTAIAMSAKPSMLVIDFAGNAGRHKIIQAADVLGGKHEPPVRQYAKQTLEQEGRPVDLEKALVRAEAELALIDEEQERRRAIKADVVKYETHEVSPFVRQFRGSQPKQSRPAGDECSDRQARFICYLSNQTGGSWTFEKAKSLSTRQASGVINKLRAGVA